VGDHVPTRGSTLWCDGVCITAGVCFGPMPVVHVAGVQAVNLCVCCRVPSCVTVLSTALDALWFPHSGTCSACPVWPAYSGLASHLPGQLQQRDGSVTERLLEACDARMASSSQRVDAFRC
jgi:hypothetical protein